MFYGIAKIFIGFKETNAQSKLSGSSSSGATGNLAYCRIKRSFHYCKQVTNEKAVFKKKVYLIFLVFFFDYMTISYICSQKRKKESYKDLGHGEGL